MKAISKTILAVIVVIALSVASKRLPVLQSVEEMVTRNRSLFLAFTISVAVLGFMLFMAGLMLMLYEKSKPMSHPEVEEQYRVIQNLRAAPYVFRRSAYRIFGNTEGRQFTEVLSFRDFKLAWRSGAWRQDKMWTYRFVVLCGALMGIFAGLATGAVASPIAISLICATALIYSAVRLTWALWRA